MLAEAVREMELTKQDIKYFDNVMSNGTKFKEWSRDTKVDMPTLAKALKYELARPRVRTDVFRCIVGMYNRLFTDLNWATANELVGRRVA